MGSGVSGLTAAYLLARVHDVILFEADERLGGHAHTHSVAGSQGPLAVDSGFIVFNDRTYPVLQRLFAELGVQGRPTEMSMSVRDDVSGIEFAGGRGLPGFVARPRQLTDPAYWRMLTGVRRFHGLAREFLAQTNDEDTTTLGEFVRAAGFGPDFIRLYAVPVVACVWSTGGRCAGLPGALPVPVPRPPRDAVDRGLAAVVHGGRWVADLCRRDRRAIAGRPLRAAGPGRAAAC